MSKLIQKYEGKSVSTRLNGDNLEYFLKFAKRKRATSVSNAFQLLIDEARKHLDLSDMEVPEELFDTRSKRIVEDAFLTENEEEKITVSFDELAKELNETEEESSANEDIPIVEKQEEPDLEIDHNPTPEEVEELEASKEPEEPEEEDDDNDNEGVITI